MGKLLRQPEAPLQVIGTHLLLAFTKIPGSSSYLRQLETFVPLVCDNAAAPGGGQKPNALKHLTTTVRHIAAKDAGDVPHAELLLRLVSLRALAVRAFTAEVCGG